jgi:Sulfotransferase domain
MRTARGILPDFIVIGAMRAGTTTLHRYLDAHPEIGMAREKETDFFVAERNWDRGLPWYQGLFEPGRARHGEASPNYTKYDIFPGIPERIRSVAPDCRLIYIVRDPVERVISQYKFRQIINPGALPEDSPVWSHIINTSRYHDQISRYAALFGRDRILVMDFDALVADPAAALRPVAGFIGVADAWGPLAEVNINSSRELARMPPWLFRLRQQRLVSGARRMLPQGVLDRLRRGLASGPERKPVGVSDAMRARIRAALADDARRFRDFAGMPFPGWSM